MKVGCQCGRWNGLAMRYTPLFMLSFGRGMIPWFQHSIEQSCSNSVPTSVQHSKKRKRVVWSHSLSLLFSPFNRNRHKCPSTGVFVEVDLQISATPQTTSAELSWTQVCRFLFQRHPSHDGLALFGAWGFDSFLSRAPFTYFFSG